ncbi:F-box only protein 27-like [Odocoileus virginianus]|uniref:F-box only protein 27-like n=1 Tax=Odocoileus virginianus TaxID=9874 RepID=A0ABM4GXD1_ODOVR
MQAAAAAGPGEETTGASASRGLPVCIPASDPEPEEGPGLSQLPVEMLLEVLSYLPASVLLGQCRHVCWYWRSLVDTRAVWLSILPYSHAKLWPVFRTCLPPDDDDDPRPCLLGRFCERRPLGRNLYPNPRGIGGVTRSKCWTWRRRVYGRNSWIVERLRFVSLPAAFMILDPVGKCVLKPRTEKFRETNHVFSNLKKGVRFVSLEHWIWDMRFLPEDYGIIVPKASVIVRVCQL